MAVFVHGCYWHHCPRCHPNLPKSNPEFWARKFELNRERDTRKRRQLEETGWRVFEFWECDIRDRVAGVMAENLRRRSRRGGSRASDIEAAEVVHQVGKRGRSAMSVFATRPGERDQSDAACEARARATGTVNSAEATHSPGMSNQAVMTPVTSATTPRMKGAREDGHS